MEIAYYGNPIRILIYLYLSLLLFIANIPRVISASYAGSEVGEFDIYAPYSYYGSEAGGDVATDINDSVWGMPMVCDNNLIPI